ncbi:unnamed protein product [Lupinus luteus]|uniref:Uncharacterized protein n=1 Tax=Lupinus luteus TaxID=3873 RepID=A0AAV1YA19_LUPLU
MGNCFFIPSNSDHVQTVKLIIVPEGKLREFSCPVKVSSLLQKYPTTFICNSDDMDFNDVVKAVDGDQMLQLGHLYFALPLSELQRKLQAEEMVALAVKASNVITKSSGKKCGFRRKRDMMFSGDEDGKCSRSVAPEDNLDIEFWRGMNESNGRKLNRVLSSIAE